MHRLPLSAVRVYALDWPSTLDLVAREARLDAEHAPRPPLAREAVADRDPERLALGREGELSTAAGSASWGHHRRHGFERGLHLGRVAFGLEVSGEGGRHAGERSTSDATGRFAAGTRVRKRREPSRGYRARVPYQSSSRWTSCRETLIASVAMSFAMQSHVPDARAAESDFQYGYINRDVPQCYTGLGYSGEMIWLKVRTEVWKYCPYGKQVDYVSQAASDIEQAIKVSCSGGVRNGVVVPDVGEFRKAFGSREAAERSRTNWSQGSANGRRTVVVDIGYIPSNYSTYNNPVNCHP